MFSFPRAYPAKSSQHGSNEPHFLSHILWLVHVSVAETGHVAGRHWTRSEREKANYIPNPEDQISAASGSTRPSYLLAALSYLCIALVQVST